ncbi:MAG: sugar ABC transporter ATP-binding protein [Ancalomicrobiaceae bacterium]|nr:sugar ABC transporter ATP-binding protein [Ancalomicrobiaceae bacterium]
MPDRTDADTTPLLVVEAMSKAFGRNSVLKGVSFSLHAGEVLALVGENGAGKSTLMNILSGGLGHDHGRMSLDGAAFAPSTPTEAAAAGVAIVHQETTILPDLSVAETIYFGSEPRNALGLIRQNELHARAARLLADLGFAISPHRLGRDLSAAERQMVEIAGAVSRSPRLLILDEPTASLSAAAAASVLQLMARLKATGMAIIFISHRLSEVIESADRVVVLKDGEMTLQAVRGAFTRDDLVVAMVGRTLSNIFPERPAEVTTQPERFALKAAGNAGLPPIDLCVRRGEVLGIAGLEGQGQKPLADALCGLRPFTCGRIEIDGQLLRLRSPAAAIAAGIASIPDDRRTEGLALTLPIRLNLSLFALRQGSRFGFLSVSHEADFAEAARRRYDIKTVDLEQPVSQLSGGNQQKVVFARWLAGEPRLLVLYEPTKGVDVETESEIYHLIGSLTQRGVAVLLISGDLLELIGLSDRIVTLYEGRISGEIARHAFSEEAIMHLASGPAPAPREAVDA